MFSSIFHHRLVLRKLSRMVKSSPRQRLHRSARLFASDVVSKEAEKDGEADVSSGSSVKPRANVPFTKELFLGRFDKSMLTFPEVMEKEEHEELEAMVQPVERFFKNLDSKSIDVNAKIPDETLQALKDLGLFGQIIPIEYGGLGLNATKYARMAELTALDTSIGVTLAAHQSIGLKGILIAGNDEQKEKYLPTLATGEKVAAFCLTEPSSGSDAASIQSRATLSEDGKTYHLSGGKIWISNGGIADIFTVFAKTESTNVVGKKEDKVTAFIVERSFGGVTSGQPEDKMGIRGSNTCEVHFDNTPVPIENVIGEVGGGFKVAMNILNSGRFSMGSAFAGSLKHLIGIASEHAINRTQFNSKLKDFELIKGKFANMAIAVYAMESMAYRTAAILDMYDAPDASVEAAMVKVFSTEQAWTMTSEALQVLGGLGYMKDYPYERYLRDCRISLIFEGTNEILRLFIALTCFQHAGGQLKETLRKYKNPLNNVGFVFKNFIDRTTDNLKSPRLRLKLFNSVHPLMSRNAEQLELRVYKFKGLVETYLGLYRDALTSEQHALSRFADVAIDLYGMTCVLGRCSRSVAIGLRNSDHEVKLADAFCYQACQRIDHHLEELKKLSMNNGDLMLNKIADDIFKEGGYAAEHPLARNW